MSHRTKPRTRTVARVAGGAGGITACVATSVLVLLGGGDPAGAAPAPKPAPKPASSQSVTTPPLLSVHLDLPGLLNVHVDVPPVNDLLGGLLGGKPAAAPATRSVAGNGPSAVPTPRATTSRTPVAAAPKPTITAAPAPRSTPGPRRTTASTGNGAGTTGLGTDTRRDTVAVRSTPKVAKVEHRKATATTDAFQRAFTTSAPVWLLGVVAALCALGTAAVVRLAGRGGRTGA